MELYIYDKARRVAGLIESYEYLRWTRRYSRCGSFELKAVATDENIALLQIGNILWKNDDQEAGLIEFLELTMQEQESITVSGRFATGFLARRIVWNTEILSGDLSTGVEQLLSHHLITPTDTTRKITGVAFNPMLLNKTVNTQISYKNLMDAVTDLCETADTGIKTVFDSRNGIFKLSFIPGRIHLRYSQRNMRILLNKSTAKASLTTQMSRWSAAKAKERNAPLLSQGTATARSVMKSSWTQRICELKNFLTVMQMPSSFAATASSWNRRWFKLWMSLSINTET